MFGELFCMDMNKTMNAYHPRLYENSITSYEKPTTYHQFTSTVSYRPTYKDTSVLTHTKNPAKGPSYTRSLLRLYKIIRPTVIHSKQTFIITFITNQEKNHHIYIIVSKHIAIWQGDWQSHEGVPEHGWGNPSWWEFWPIQPRASGRYLKLQKRPEGPLVEKFLQKGSKLKNQYYSIFFLWKYFQLLTTVPSAFNTTINASLSWIKSFRKNGPT